MIHFAVVDDDEINVIKGNFALQVPDELIGMRQPDGIDENGLLFLDYVRVLA